MTSAPSSLAETAIGPPNRKLRPARTVLLGRLAVLALLVALWSFTAMASPLLSSPAETLLTLYDGFDEGWIEGPLVDSLKAVAIGFAIALALGVPAGILLGLSRRLNDLLDPFIVALFAIPRIIVYPAIISAIGVGLQAKVWMAVLCAVFPVLMNTIAGIRDTTLALRKLGRSLGMSTPAQVWHIFVPNAIPAIMVGVRIGLSVSFLGVIVAELFAANAGLGELIQSSYALQQYPRMFAVVLLVTVLSFVVNLGLWSLERRIRSSID